MTSSRTFVHILTAIELAIVPEGQKSAASMPMVSADSASSFWTVGSSPRTSSPTTASAMARRIFSVGLVTVSLLKSEYVIIIRLLRGSIICKSRASGNRIRMEQEDA
jgi:hypothetical protein